MEDGRWKMEDGISRKMAPIFHFPSPIFDTCLPFETSSQSVSNHSPLDHCPGQLLHGRRTWTIGRPHEWIAGERQELDPMDCLGSAFWTVSARACERGAWGRTSSVERQSVEPSLHASRSHAP